jgi:hypothetical protein
VIVDIGPLKAAIDAGDVDHEWAVKAFCFVRGRFITFEAAITGPARSGKPGGYERCADLSQEWSVTSVAAEFLGPVFDEAETWAPRMDFADACAVVRVRRFERSFVFATDFRDFSTCRILFASPEGAFYDG